MSRQACAWRRRRSAAPARGWRKRGRRSLSPRLSRSTRILNFAIEFRRHDCKPERGDIRGESARILTPRDTSYPALRARAARIDAATFSRLMERRAAIRGAFAAFSRIMTPSCVRPRRASAFRTMSAPRSVRPPPSTSSATCLITTAQMGEPRHARRISRRRSRRPPEPAGPALRRPDRLRLRRGSHRHRHRGNDRKPARRISRLPLIKPVSGQAALPRP